jgi:hypothetical protein
MLLLLLIIFAAVGSPFPALVLGAYILLREETRLLRWIRVVTLIFLVIYLGYLYSGLRFTNGGIRFLTGTLAIGSYCLLASTAFEIRPIALRATTLFVLGTPICILTAVATFASMFDSDSYKATTMRAGLVCREGSYGMVGAGGDRIGLYKSWPGLPFIEREVAGDISDDAAPKKDLSSCAELLRKYENGKR